MPTIFLKRFQGCQNLSHLGCDIVEFESRLRSIPQLNKYAFILHDSDKQDDGTLKAPHIHFCCTLHNNATLNSVANILGLAPQYIERIKGSTRTMMAYLIHFNAPEKYQYDCANVHCNFDYQKDIIDKLNDKIDGSPEFSIDNVRPQILSGACREYNLFDYIPLEWYAVRKNQMDVEASFKAYRLKRVNEMRAGNLKMDVIFLTGKAGTGKTTFAKMIAEERGKVAYISSSGENFLDDYRGEPCIILDDFRGSDCKLNALLKLLDNHTRSAVRARYSNKVLSDCELIIITSTVSPLEFYRGVFENECEELYQFVRRLGAVYELEEDIIKVLSWDGRGYQCVGTLSNPVSLKYPKQISVGFGVDFSLQGLGRLGDSFKPIREKEPTIDIRKSEQMWISSSKLGDDEELPF